MRLQHLCDMELAYREESLYQGMFVVARPYESQEAEAYGEGDGWVKGELLKGKARWVNHPHCRSDGVWLPNLQGVIQTEAFHEQQSLVMNKRNRISHRGEKPLILMVVA